MTVEVMHMMFDPSHVLVDLEDFVSNSEKTETDFTSEGDYGY